MTKPVAVRAAHGQRRWARGLYQYESMSGTAGGGGCARGHWFFTGAGVPTAVVGSTILATTSARTAAVFVGFERQSFILESLCLRGTGVF